jgi:hypothetical protein
MEAVSERDFLNAHITTTVELDPDWREKIRQYLIGVLPQKAVAMVGRLILPLISPNLSATVGISERGSGMSETWG